MAAVNATGAVLFVIALAGFLLLVVQPLLARWYRAIEPGLPAAMHGRGTWYTRFVQAFVVAFCAGLLLSLLLGTVVPVVVAVLLALLLGTALDSRGRRT